MRTRCPISRRPSTTPRSPRTRPSGTSGPPIHAAGDSTTSRNSRPVASGSSHTDRARRRRDGQDPAPSSVPLRDRHAVLGAARGRVTGADISGAAVELATALAVELGLPDARFVRSNLYGLRDVLDGTFDVVYTSRGALNWLPDIRDWARVVAHFLAPGGTFFITEMHPVANVFENEGVAPGELRPTYPYWEHAQPLVFPVTGTYADRDAVVADQTEHSWDHGWRDRHRPRRHGSPDREAHRAPVPRLERGLPGRGSGRELLPARGHPR